MYHAELRQVPRRTLLRRAALAAGAFLIALVLSFFLQSHCLVAATDPKDQKQFGTVYYPLWLSGDVGKQVSAVGGRQAAVDDWGPVEMKQRLAAMPGGQFARTVTSVVLALVYAICSIALVVAFALFWFYFTPASEGPNVRDPAPPPTPSHPPLRPAPPALPNDLKEGAD
jgi:hypothetical protein